MKQEKLSNKKLTTAVSELAHNDAKIINFIQAYLEFNGHTDKFKEYLDKKVKEAQKKQLFPPCEKIINYY